MKRTLLAAALAGLAIGGCAHSKSARAPEAEGGPVGLTPTPSIHDTINRGTNPSVAKSTLPNPANPNWSGAPLISRRPETGLAPRVAAADGSAPAPAPAAPKTRWSEPPRELPAEATTAPAAMDDEANDGASLPPAVEADPAEEPLAPTEAPAAPAEAAPAAPPEAAPAEAAPAEDPLLGPSPELMPAIEPSAGPAPAPALEAAPAGSDPAPAGEEDAPPSLEAAPSSTAASASATRVDAMVQRVSTDSAPAGADVDDSHWKQAGLSAARVGDDVVTLGELRIAVKEAVQKRGGKVSQLSRDELNYVAQNVLAALIERTLLVQEAKHMLKSNDKQLSKLQEAADAFWRENELPSLLRQYFVEDERQLRRKFEEEGRSLSAIQSEFRQEFVAHSFLMQKIGDKIDVGLPEMLKYYEQHRGDKTNHRGPTIVWREILVDKSKHASPAEARAKADALLARLRQGEDFAAVATAESEGPALIKAAGGLMETAPGGYVVAAVNRAVETLPLNTVSDVVEGPDSFHVVRVESRGAGGPATFAELQDSIRTALREQKMVRQRTLLIASLRKKTIITTIFDGTASDPNQASR